jgi:hypothetical protein
MAVLRLEEGARRRRIVEAAPREHLGEHSAHAELALEPLEGLERNRRYLKPRGGVG